MKKYSLKQLAMEITGQDEYYWGWDATYELVRRIDKTIKLLFGIKHVTDENKDRYLTILKHSYENDDIRRLLNKQTKIMEKLNKIEVIDGTLTIPSDLKNLTKEEYIKFLEIMIQAYRGTEFEHIIEERIELMKSEEYNKVLAKFEEEVDRIKMSIQGYPYRDKVLKMKELHEYLEIQRSEIDKNINDNLILPE